MKLGFLFLALAVISQSSYAESYTFACGQVGNVARTLTVSSKAPGEDGYVLKATYQTGGRDAATGMQTKKTYELVGQSDIVSNNGKQISALTFLQMSNVNFQVVVAKTKKIGAVVDGAEINLSNTKDPETAFKCTLKSYKK